MNDEEKKIIITRHAQNRSAKTKIDASWFIKILKLIIIECNMQERGIYKCRRGGTAFIIDKNENSYTLITAYGPMKWILEDNPSVIGFKCKKSEYRQRK